MADVTTALVGVGGTLLGAAATFAFGWLNAGRTQQNDRLLRLRAERMEVYTAFAGAVIEYRRAEVTRWRRVATEAEWSASEWAQEVYATRSAATHARYRVLLVADDPGLEQLATAALEHATGLAQAADRADLNARAEVCQATVERFVRAARAQLDLSGVATGPASRTA